MKKYALMACWLLGAAMSSVQAGQDCGERPAPSGAALAQGLQLGEKVREQLEKSGASAALVARAGLNLSEYGQTYSHMGVAVRDHVHGTWWVVHLFNPCGKAQSELLRQRLEKFWEVELHGFQALVIDLPYEQQALLRALVMSPIRSGLLHEKSYNLIAHPFNTRFQNSNQWILESFTATMDGSISNRAAAQTWLKAKQYEPGKIRIPNARRSAARLFSAHVSFSDHTQEEYEQQQYLVVTVQSISDFVNRMLPTARNTEIR
jgi:hypothetical protein